MADFHTSTQIHKRTLVLLLRSKKTFNVKDLIQSLLLKSLVVFCCLFSTAFDLAAQKKLSSSNKKALKFYEKGQEKTKERDFESAIDFYSRAIVADPNFHEAYFRKGSLYRAMGVEDSVYDSFTTYLSLTKYPAPTVLSEVANMAFRRGAYNLAKGWIEKAVKVGPSMVKDREIQLLRNSLEFAISESKKDSSLNITLLPKEINQFALQYLPTITIDNSAIYFTKRDQIKGDEDIVVSYYENGAWGDAQSISSKINTPMNEGACAVSANGRTLIFTSCDKRDSFGSCDLYISQKVGESWTRPKNIGKPVSSPYWESQPSLSADGKKLFFTSTRPGGQGGRDIWVSYHRGGNWTRPFNLGKHVNTFKDETTPFIHPNGETLYFSSNGHVSMGGFDLYQSTLTDSTWKEVKNLGYPVNTHHDEVALLIAGDGQTAYFAKEKERNYQLVESRLVSFELPNRLKTKPATYIIGKVVNDETSEPLRANLEVYDLKKDELLFEAKSDSLTGDYVMVLPSGKELGGYVKKKGFLFYDYHFISEPNTPAIPDTIEIRLKPIAVGQSLVLKNIYFETSSYELDDKSKTEINNVVEILKDNPKILVEISGHTDNIGSKTYNLKLSENRAKSVLQELVRFGISATRVKYRGYADEQPIATNETEEGRQSNRRIEFSVIQTEP